MTLLDACNLNDDCRAAGLPWQVRVEEEITSTSDALRDIALQGHHPNLVLFAELQSRGRGRRDNRWLAPKGRDLTFSLLLRPGAPLALWPRFTTLAALAVCRAVEDELPLEPRIKWPNDIYLGDRKTGGILAEVIAGREGACLVLGIGVNVNTREFPSGLAAHATSLACEVRATAVVDLDRQRLAYLLLRQLDMQFQRIDDGFIEAVGEVRERSWLLGKQIRAVVHGRELHGRVIDLNGEGQLVLKLPDSSIATLASADSVRQVV